ncbi:hypothetical protein EGJ22_07780 [Pseudomonas sp. p99-361]|nr:hypothetical protein HV87_02680 [Pseudomonas aeruginosa]RRV20427.1 hypothetical protein EGJ22_07780 [Pseudomonas sp. p99-361]
MSRKGRKAAPAIDKSLLKPWGRGAPLSRHKAAPTEAGAGFRPTAAPTPPGDTAAAPCSPPGPAGGSCARHHHG